MENALIRGDLSRLNEPQRLQYYQAICRSVGLNPLTKPFDYITLQGKLTLYANKDCAAQLRRNHNISVRVVDRTQIEDLYVVTVQAEDPDGRVDDATGAVHLKKSTGEALANLMMKAETKAKRRATLSICGLGFLDEEEAADAAGVVEVDLIEPQALPEASAPDSGPDESNPGETEPTPLPFISDAQRRRMWALCQKNNVSESTLREYLKEQWNIESTKNIQRGEQYEAICSWVSQ